MSILTSAFFGGVQQEVHRALPDSAYPMGGYAPCAGIGNHLSSHRKYRCNLMKTPVTRRHPASEIPAAVRPAAASAEAAAPAATRRLLRPSPELSAKINLAFVNYGYESLSMSTLAKACGFSRAALYQYFRSKEEAFRLATRSVNVVAIEGALAAGERLRQEGHSAIDIFAEITCARYTLMRLNGLFSPHRVELNAVAWRNCSDILIEVSLLFRDGLAEMLTKLFADARLKPREGLATVEIAQALADGARGVDQSLPAPTAEELPARHRQMVSAVLYGCLMERAAGRRKTTDSP
jgi:AcrR family transcriptional regulator